VELLSVEYGNFPDLFGGDLPEGWQDTCLKARLSVDLALIGGQDIPGMIAERLAPVFPTLRRIQPASPGLDAQGEPAVIACLTGGVIADLQRNLCTWPAGLRYRCRELNSRAQYELCVESVDERVGLFAAQLGVEVVRKALHQERLDQRLACVADLVRHLHHRPRLRLTPRRVAGVVGCSRHDARWAIQELERYGYLSVDESPSPRQAREERILIVDDNPQMRDLLSRVLERLGYTAIAAVDGEEGLILLEWMSYQAIFVDLIMPSLDGPTFLRQARARGVTCPIFAISAYDHRWDAHEIQAMGATAYIAKPFSIAEIQALIKKHVK
jgi:CheY-like chemotaxis protein